MSVRMSRFLVFLFLMAVVPLGCGVTIDNTNKTDSGVDTTTPDVVAPIEDEDGDGIADQADNCPNDANTDQLNTDSDALGDVCDTDDDNDGYPDDDDCDPTDAEIGACFMWYADGDQDGYGGAGDANCACVATASYPYASADDCADDDDEIHPGVEEICDGIDQNCDDDTDEGFPDLDEDGAADCVDTDDDGDQVGDGVDNCPAAYNPDQGNVDGDDQGDICDDDADGDGVLNESDNCPFTPNPDQDDICVDDQDGDGLLNEDDNCPNQPNPDQLDTDEDNQGNACDSDDDNDGSPDLSDCEPLNFYVHPDAMDSCNGKDDDCDGETDELTVNGGGTKMFFKDADEDGFRDGVVNQWSCAPTGIYTLDVDAGLDCDDDDPNVNPGQPELCNGADDNCNGVADEGAAFAQLGTACDTDADTDDCEDGTYVCTADGQGVSCNDSAAGGSSVEICNGADDDCDGQVDEGYPGLGDECDASTVPGCQTSSMVCNADGDGVVCGNLDQSAKMPVANLVVSTGVETCNGEDDDCDNLTDEDFFLGEACDGDDTDQCATGVWQCATNGQAECVGGEEGSDQEEVCNGLDDDCDGSTDEDFNLNEACPLLGQPGECSVGANVCINNGKSCQHVGFPNDPIFGFGVSEAKCNHKDDDCDNLTDEDVIFVVPAGDDTENCSGNDCFEFDSFEKYKKLPWKSATENDPEHGKAMVTIQSFFNSASDWDGWANDFGANPYSTKYDNIIGDQDFNRRVIFVCERPESEEIKEDWAQVPANPLSYYPENKEYQDPITVTFRVRERKENRDADPPLNPVPYTNIFQAFFANGWSEHINVGQFVNHTDAPHGQIQLEAGGCAFVELTAQGSNNCGWSDAQLLLGDPPTKMDGTCDEGLLTGGCPWGTDVNDCGSIFDVAIGVRPYYVPDQYKVCAQGDPDDCQFYPAKDADGNEIGDEIPASPCASKYTVNCRFISGYQWWTLQKAVSGCEPFFVD